MAWNPTAVILATLASSVLPSLAGTAVADEAAARCQKQQDAEAGVALLQHRVANEKTAAKPARAKLPPFPTLTPPNGAEFLEEELWASDDDPVEGEDEQEEEFSGPKKGVATVRLDSMSRPMAQDNLLEHAAEKRPAKSGREKKREVSRGSSAKVVGMSQKRTAGKRRKAIKDELEEEYDMEDSSAVSGKTASLDSSGYKAVADGRSHKDMKSFVQRVVNKLGYHVASTGDLDGFVQYYSGEKGVQSFDKMQKEIHAIAHKRGRAHWIWPKGDAALKEFAGLGAFDD